MLGVDEGELVKKLAVSGGGEGSGFVYLARRVPPSVADDIKRLKLGGVDVTAGSRRTYPHGMLAAQVLGSVNLDGKGLFGLEFAEDKTLRGTDGERVSVYNGERRAIEIRDVHTAVPGATMR